MCIVDDQGFNTHTRVCVCEEERDTEEEISSCNLFLSRGSSCNP